MQKIEAKKWHDARESFDQYAIDKLALMHRLNLPVMDRIHLLIGSITQSPLRVTVLSLKTDWWRISSTACDPSPKASHRDREEGSEQRSTEGQRRLLQKLW